MAQFFSKLGLTKERLLQMLLTAILSALLAFIQNLLTSIASTPQAQNLPVVAGVIGGGISFFTQNKC